jgi:hypothetical protein
MNFRIKASNAEGLDANLPYGIALNADVGQTAYLGLPYYGRWLLSAALILVDKQFVTNIELSDKIAEVKKRYE